MLMPLTGGAPRRFSAKARNAPAWSPDGTRLVYCHKPDRDDPLFVADRTGADPRQFLSAGRATRCTTTIRSGRQTASGSTSSRAGADRIEMTWTSGAFDRPAVRRERLTAATCRREFPGAARRRDAALHRARRGLVGPVAVGARCRDARWPARVVSGLEHYTSVVGQPRRPPRRRHRRQSSCEPLACAAARSPGRRSDAQPLPAADADGRALAPRFGGKSLFYLSSGGTGDGLWRLEAGRRRRSGEERDGALSEPPAVSPDGRASPSSSGKDGRRQLSIMSADGTNRADAGAVDRDRRRRRTGHRRLVARRPVDRRWRHRRQGPGAVHDPCRWRRARPARRGQVRSIPSGRRTGT